MHSLRCTACTKSYTDENDMNDLLDSMPDLDLNLDYSIEGYDLNPSSKEDPVEIEVPIYLPEGTVDPRIKLLSHSSRSTLNKCPRKFQLYRLNGLENEADSMAATNQQITFDYGTCVGVGIQGVLEGKNMDSVYIQMLMEWSVDFLDRNPKQKKSFWEAMLAVQQFHKLYLGGYMQEHELLYFTDPETGDKRPAVELGFKINLPNGYAYRGYIDGVLKHKLTGAVTVLEDKTTSFRQVNSASYKNSGQALGYSVILDLLFPGLSSYTVLYLVYSSTSREYTELPFEKSAQQRAQWLTELLMDTKKIDMYEDFSLYPMNGDFCYDFFKDCEYLGLCTMSTERLTKMLTQKMLDGMAKREESYDFTFEFDELIQAQVDKI